MSARSRAEACFAVARSATFAGEREAAINRGLAICERAELDPDDFDIPGRAPVARKPSMSGKRASRVHVDDPYAPFHERGSSYTARGGPSWSGRQYSADELSELMRKVRDTVRQQEAAQRAARQAERQAKARNKAWDDLAAAMNQARAEAGAREDETLAEAIRRNFDRATAEAKARDEARARPPTSGERWPTTQRVVDYLWSLNVAVYDLGEDEAERWFVPSQGGLSYTDAGLRELADRLFQEGRHA